MSRGRSLRKQRKINKARPPRGFSAPHQRTIQNATTCWFDETKRFGCLFPLGLACSAAFQWPLWCLGDAKDPRYSYRVYGVIFALVAKLALVILFHTNVPREVKRHQLMRELAAVASLTGRWTLILATAILTCRWALSAVVAPQSYWDSRLQSDLDSWLLSHLMSESLSPWLTQLLWQLQMQSQLESQEPAVALVTLATGAWVWIDQISWKLDEAVHERLERARDRGRRRITRGSSKGRHGRFAYAGAQGSRRIVDRNPSRPAREASSGGEIATMGGGVLGALILGAGINRLIDRAVARVRDWFER